MKEKNLRQSSQGFWSFRQSSKGYGNLLKLGGLVELSMTSRWVLKFSTFFRELLKTSVVSWKLLKPWTVSQKFSEIFDNLLKISEVFASLLKDNKVFGSLSKDSEVFRCLPKCSEALTISWNPLQRPESFWSLRQCLNLDIQNIIQWRLACITIWIIIQFWVVGYAIFYQIMSKVN